MRVCLGLRCFLVWVGTGWAWGAHAEERASGTAAYSNFGALGATQLQLEYARESREGARWLQGVRERRYDAEGLARARAEQERASEQWQSEESRRFSEEHRFREVTQALPERDGASRREALRMEARRRLEAAAQRRAEEEMGHLPQSAEESGTQTTPLEIPGPELPPKGLPPVPLAMREEGAQEEDEDEEDPSASSDEDSSPTVAAAMRPEGEHSSSTTVPSRASAPPRRFDESGKAAAQARTPRRPSRP